MYNQKVIDLFTNPINAGAMKGANAIGIAESENQGDRLKLYLKINEENIIEDASFETYGCAAAIASSSMFTQLIKGKKLGDALKINNEQIVKHLGGLPEHKIQCSVLAGEAIKSAVKYFNKMKNK